jgi:hypothetical protein
MNAVLDRVRDLATSDAHHRAFYRDAAELRATLDLGSDADLLAVKSAYRSARHQAVHAAPVRARGAANRLGGTGRPLGVNGRTAGQGSPVSVVRWRRDEHGDWGHKLVAGAFLSLCPDGVRLVVDGAERVFREADGRAVCCED